MLRRCEPRIKVHRFPPCRQRVETAVYVVGTAFERLHLQAPLLQGPQDAHGESGLTASRAHGADQQLRFPVHRLFNVHGTDDVEAEALGEFHALFDRTRLAIVDIDGREGSFRLAFHFAANTDVGLVVDHDAAL